MQRRPDRFTEPTRQRPPDLRTARSRIPEAIGRLCVPLLCDGCNSQMGFRMELAGLEPATSWVRYRSNSVM
jgi:hypothetical protein